MAHGGRTARSTPYDQDPHVIISFADLAARVRAASPRLDTVRLVCVDGRSGAGKTTFAARLSAVLGRCPVIHADDLYPGWHGLDAFGDRLVDWVIDPLLRGEPAGYRRYDWHRGCYAEQHPLPPTDVLIVEGVGAAQRRTDPVAVLRIWLDAHAIERYRRGIDRDGDGFRPYWQLWAAQEEQHFATERTRERADLVVDGDPPADLAYDPVSQLAVREIRRWPEPATD